MSISKFRSYQRPTNGRVGFIVLCKIQKPTVIILIKKIEIFYLDPEKNTNEYVVTLREQFLLITQAR